MGAYLVRLHYRDDDDRKIIVWGLTERGYRVAARVLGDIGKLPGHDVGPWFLQHETELNDVLTAALRKDPKAPAELPKSFRWIHGESLKLSFQMRVKEGNPNRLLRPDAVLEVPGLRRRYFLEYETGASSLTNKRKATSTVTKVERYTAYIADSAHFNGPTWYQRAFPDALEPQLVFVVRSEARKVSIERLVAQWSKKDSRVRDRINVLTHEGAAAWVRERVNGIASPPTEPTRPAMSEVPPPVASPRPMVAMPAAKPRTIQLKKGEEDVVILEFRAKTDEILREAWKAITHYNVFRGRKAPLPVPQSPASASQLTDIMRKFSYMSIEVTRAEIQGMHDFYKDVVGCIAKGLKTIDEHNGSFKIWRKRIPRPKIDTSIFERFASVVDALEKRARSAGI